MTRPHLEGLIRLAVEIEAACPSYAGPDVSYQVDASTAWQWAQQLRALAALPGGGVDVDRIAAAVWTAMGDENYLFGAGPFEDAHPDDQNAARRIGIAAIAATCPTCKGRGYTDEGDPEVGSALFECERCAALSPTPNPHEADRNG